MLTKNEIKQMYKEIKHMNGIDLASYLNSWIDDPSMVAKSYSDGSEVYLQDTHTLERHFVFGRWSHWQSTVAMSFNDLVTRLYFKNHFLLEEPEFPEVASKGELKEAIIWWVFHALEINKTVEAYYTTVRTKFDEIKPTDSWFNYRGEVL